MRNSQRFVVLSIVATILSFPARGEDFYEARLREGREALAAKRTILAVERLRIAVFGLLDKPVLLSEGLAMLAMAQAAAGKEAASDATVTRFIELEKGFVVWDKTSVQPSLRRDFEALLVKKVQADTLAGIPSLARLAETEEQKILKLSPSVRGKVLEAKAKAEPRDVRWPLMLAMDAARAGDRKAAARWAKRVLSIEPENKDALAIERAETPSPAPGGQPGAGSIADARTLMNEGKPAAARAILIPAVQKEPADRNARKALLEAAYLSKDWALCAAQIEFLKPFETGEEPQMFYSAVALFETGNLDEAKVLIQKARPALSAGPSVDYYTKRILGRNP